MPNGLLKAHAYNLIEVLKTRKGLILYKVRDIWRSKLSWEGQYAKDSPKWTEQLQNELKFDPLDDSYNDIIWMTEQEFTESFATVTVCMVR